MPSKQGRADRILESALTALARALEESKAPWAIIGGIAIIARGVRRLTTDGHAAVRGDVVRAKRLAKVLAKHEALAIATPTLLGSVEARICLPESLVVFKAIAGRPKDVDDMEALLDLYPNIDRQRVRTRVAELAALAEAPEMLQRFDLLLAQLAKTTPVVASSPARVRRKPTPPKKRPLKPKR